MGHKLWKFNNNLFFRQWDFAYIKIYFGSFIKDFLNFKFRITFRLTFLKIIFYV